MGLCVIQTSPFRSCSCTPHPPPQNTLFNLFNTPFTYKVERQYPLMCLVVACRPINCGQCPWHHPGGQRGHRSARPHAVLIEPLTHRRHVTHMFTRRHAQRIGNLLPRQFPSPAISFHVNLNGTVSGTSPRPPRTSWSCAHDAHSLCTLYVHGAPWVLYVLFVSPCKWCAPCAPHAPCAPCAPCQLLSALVPPPVDRTFSLVPPGCRIG